MLERRLSDRESTNNEGALMATIDSMNKDTTRLSDGPDWTFELLDVYLAEIDRVAKLYRLDTYPHQIEVITSEQMMDAYSSVGMPINYPHWSFGKNSLKPSRPISTVSRAGV
jgi:spore cortex formation protein SpoVR/YcgB (stage V sporulation)